MVVSMVAGRIIARDRPLQVDAGRGDGDRRGLMVGFTFVDAHTPLWVLGAA